MRASHIVWVIISITMFAFSHGAWAQATTTVLSAVSPNARAVQVGGTASVYGLFLNTGDAIAQDCDITLNGDFSGTYEVSATDYTTNEVSIYGAAWRWDVYPGDYGTYVISITPDAVHDSVEIAPVFQCANTDPAPVFSGVNTFTFSASNTPMPDIIASALTYQANGIMDIPGIGNAGFFVVATTNMGAAGDVVVSGQALGAAISSIMDIQVCETDPGTSACLASPATEVTVNYAQNEVKTFALFATASDTFPFDPGNSRVFARFAKPGGMLLGSASIAPRFASTEVADELVIAPNDLFIGDGPGQEVHMRMEMAGDWLASGLSSSTLQVREIDPETGDPIGVFGMLYDDGDPAHGDEMGGDRIYNNIFQIDPQSQENVRYFQAWLPEFQVGSDYFALNTLDDMTEASYLAIQNVLINTEASLKADIAGGTAPSQAIDTALTSLKSNTQWVTGAGRLEDNAGVWVYTTQGTFGLINLNEYEGSVLRGGGAVRSTPSERQLAATFLQQAGQSPAFARKQSSTPAHPKWLAGPTATSPQNIVGANKALVLSPATDLGTTEGAYVADKLDQFGMDVTYKSTIDVKINDYKNLEQYGVIYIITHGTSSFDDYTAEMTDEQKADFMKKLKKASRQVFTRTKVYDNLDPFLTKYGQYLKIFIKPGPYAFTSDGVGQSSPGPEELRELKSLHLAQTPSGFYISGLFIDAYSGKFPNSLVFIAAC